MKYISLVNTIPKPSRIIMHGPFLDHNLNGVVHSDLRLETVELFTSHGRRLQVREQPLFGKIA